MHVRRRFVALAAGLTTALSLGLAGPATATAGTAPPTPFNFYVNNVTDTLVSMQWSPGALTEPTRWRVYQNDVLVTTSLGSAYVARNLVPGQTYGYRIVAVDASGDVAAPTRTITVTTRGPGVQPGAPSGLRATEVSPARVSLEFDRPGDEFDVWAYQVFDGPTLVGTAAARFAQPTATVTIRRLAPGSAHSYTVRALRSGGLSAPSNALAVTTPATTDVTPPGTPSGLTGRIARYTCDNAALTWTPSADDRDAAADIDYEVFGNGRLIGVARGTGAATVWLPDPGGNTITVRAVDSSGNASAAGNAITLTVDPACEP
ncbi:fibronectin type III domain-containing protein [Jiangella aurantiaca]|uniref:Fibronectin type III domain-containing protein n=1 Tax=Jiangella aurantiaca TaxID=2530373 RepID=A0A4R5AP35_9ACTN|nr:fibronectin type III domain-containing protein [Jiangella aurantiaca]TDD72062.1 fibronectin type III domain-containing protein [Jiangella aurantiaca]